jgi:shikimate dehydrogenase
VDADTEIIRLAGKTIPEIFAEGGEKLFRDFETKVLADLGKRSGLVIATGGGCVTQQRNYAHLHQNGKIIWLKRDLNLLPTDGRPLSQTNDLSTMYAIRQPLYKTFSDFVIENNTSIDHVVASIVEVCR